MCMWLSDEQIVVYFKQTQQNIQYMIIFPVSGHRWRVCLFLGVSLQHGPTYMMIVFCKRSFEPQEIAKEEDWRPTRNFDMDGSAFVLRLNWFKLNLYKGIMHKADSKVFIARSLTSLLLRYLLLLCIKDIRSSFINCKLAWLILWLLY